MGKLYEIAQGIGTLYDREMELENLNHLAAHIKTIERDEESSHQFQAYTDCSKSDSGVGAGIVIFLDNNLLTTLQ